MAVGPVGWVQSLRKNRCVFLLCCWWLMLWCYKSVYLSLFRRTQDQRNWWLFLKRYKIGLLCIYFWKASSSYCKTSGVADMLLWCSFNAVIIITPAATIKNLYKQKKSATKTKSLHPLTSFSFIMRVETI